MTPSIATLISNVLMQDFQVSLEQATPTQLYQAVSKAAMVRVADHWDPFHTEKKRVGYFSAEFLIGRLIYANLLNMGQLHAVQEYLRKSEIDFGVFEEIEDAALGNGGLGRLAACFLDSAATHNIPLDGYGIRYRYGLFKQYFEHGFQKEAVDDWLQSGDPWSIRRDNEKVTVTFSGQTVYAVPYDYPIIGYGMKTVNTLRLWQAEPLCGFDFHLFNEQKYEAAVKERNHAETISSVLYPNDDTDKGKRLRLKQQYFFCSASLQDILRRYKQRHGTDFSHFPDEVAIQLNDTHPVVSIPELMRLLVENEGIPFNDAFTITKEVFAYTNHTIMPEALEKWNVRLFRSVLPQVYPYINKLHRMFIRELKKKKTPEDQLSLYSIVEGTTIHMARLAIYATHSTNGVAKIHTDIIKETALPEWYALFPERFNNKTNGITQRRWLALANAELAELITDAVGSGWLTNLTRLKKLESKLDDVAFLDSFRHVKQLKKQQLKEYIQKKEGFTIREDFLLDVQVKRLHEYKRQLLNAFSILDIYFGIRDGRLNNFTPTVFLFGAKAAPGYFRAKGIIKFINEIANLVNHDSTVKDYMQVVFVSNYNVSYAEKIIPAADISEQISTAGTEASGTSNMKFMLNGAVTLGTYDGANVEIVEQAGKENNYIFGATVEEIEQLKQLYNPKAIMDAEPRLARVVKTLIDGTFDDGGTGMFRELYTSLTEGASWHKPDHYFLFQDFIPYCETRLRANRDYRDSDAFARKCVANIAGSGVFSSDRTIQQYAEEIWNV